MSNPPVVIPTKLLAPRRSPSVLARPRLLSRLEEGASRKVLLLSADAGFGKTTLLADFLARSERSCLWFSLDEGDQDLAVLFAHLLHGLRARYPKFGAHVGPLFDQVRDLSREIESVVGAFVSDLMAVPQTDFYFAFDDFQNLGTDSLSVKFVKRWLEVLPPKAHVILASRSEPSFPLSRLRSKGDLFELRQSDLAFDEREVREILDTVYRIPHTEGDLHELARVTEGWITGIRLITETTRGDGGEALSAALGRFRASRETLHAYFLEELLEKETPEVRDVLFRSSVLEEVDEEGLREVLGLEDPQRWITSLESRNLLHAYGTGSLRTHRYHQLFREFLLSRLAVERGDREREALHLRAADLQLRRGLLPQAFGQLVLARAFDRMAALVNETAPTAVPRGQHALLARWIDALPPAMIEADPRLLLHRADVRQLLGEWESVEPDYHAARARFRERGDREGEARTLLGLSRIKNLRGHHDEVIRMGEEALTLLGTRERGLRARLYQRVAGASFYLGRYAEAARLTRREQELLAKEKRVHESKAALHNLAITYAAMGDFPKARAAFEELLESREIRTGPRGALYLANYALLLVEHGEYTPAREALEEGLKLAQAYSNRGQDLSCGLTLAHLHAELGDAERALASLREVEEKNREMKIHVVASDIQGLRGAVFLRQGEIQRAREFTRKALGLAGEPRADANYLKLRIQEGEVELRAGRFREARRIFLEALELAGEAEVQFPRTKIRFGLAEAERRLGRRGAEENLAEALSLAQRYGHLPYLLRKARESFALFRFGLSKDVEPDTIAEIATMVGPRIVPELLEALPGAPSRARLAILAALAEMGDGKTLAALGPLEASRDKETAAAAEAAREAIAARLGRTQRRGVESGKIQVELLGPLVIQRGEDVIPERAWRSQRALSLFCYLLLRGNRGETKERLVDLFWPGERLSAARRNFHPTLSYVRRALSARPGEEILIYEDGKYRVSPDLPIRTDVSEFEAAIAAAKREAPGKRGRDLDAFRTAVSLYRGDLLEEHYFDWAEEPRVRLAALYEEALERLADHLFTAGEFGESLSLYKLLLRRDAFRESAHARVMVCLQKSGDRKGVEEHYRSLKQLLRKELDLDPLPETTRTYERLLHGV